MKKTNNFFITSLVAGLVIFSAALAIPTQMAQALIKTEQIENNAITSPKIKDGEVKTPDLAIAAVTKPKLYPNAVKLVVIARQESFTVQANTVGQGASPCNSDEVVTGGGYQVEIDSSVLRSDKFGNGWGVLVLNSGDEGLNGVVSAECAHLELGP